MKRFFKGGLISLFLLLFLFSGVTIHTLLQSQTNGRLINYVGIVRGASQRLIKLEISDQPSDEMIEYLDGILSELQGGEAVYGLPDPGDPAYQMELAADVDSDQGRDRRQPQRVRRQHKAPCSKRGFF